MKFFIYFLICTACWAADDTEKKQLVQAARLSKQSDLVASMKIYKSLADKGNSEAQYQFGYYLRVYKKDYSNAAHYYRLAANQGHLDAYMYLHPCYTSCGIL